MTKTLLPLLILPALALAAPSTPISRGRLVTDLDGAGYSITNSPMATTNFVWEAVASVTNEPWGASGITTNDVRAIVAPFEDLATEAKYIADHAEGTAENNRQAIAALAVVANTGSYYDLVDLPDLTEYATKDSIASLDIRTNIPPVSASATVGELVDAINAVIRAMKKEDE